MPIYLEYIIAQERNAFNFETGLELLMIETESIKDAVDNTKKVLKNMINVLTGFIDQQKQIFSLYIEKAKINHFMKVLDKMISTNKEFANSKIRVRGYNKQILDIKTLNDEILMTKNLIAITKLKSDKRSKMGNTMYDLYQKYNKDKNRWDTFYEISVKDISKVLTKTINDIGIEIEELKSDLFELTHYFDKLENTDETNKQDLSRFIESIKESVSKKYNILVMNIEAVKYEVGKSISKKVENLAGKNVHRELKIESELSLPEKRKSAEEAGSITYGDNTYKIYKMKEKNVSCMNYGGLNIYVDNGFFDMPKGYQLAILYHEIGHHQCGHFGPNESQLKTVKIEDETKVIKRIKRDCRKFLNSVASNNRFISKSINDGSEFLYLLLEWEADRFASDQVGKNMISMALTSRFNESLDSILFSNDKKENNLHKDYNKWRMALRTENI